MITTSLCNSFKLELLRGEHRAGDEYRIALIKHEGKGLFGKATENYAQLGADEAEGPGYAKGGLALSGYKAALDGDAASIGWGDAIWPTASLSADGALIYNATQGGKAVQVVSFADTSSVPVVSVNAPFTVAVGVGKGQIRLT